MEMNQALQLIREEEKRRKNEKKVQDFEKKFDRKTLEMKTELRMRRDYGIGAAGKTAAQSLSAAAGKLSRGTVSPGGKSLQTLSGIGKTAGTNRLSQEFVKSAGQNGIKSLSAGKNEKQRDGENER